jgi:hypothetical protein|tara:strand:+ start:754 stop:957 length:204 start_codon:yes stop_codon:yes gene_type:complete
MVYKSRKQAVKFNPIAKDLHKDKYHQRVKQGKRRQDVDTLAEELELFYEQDDEELELFYEQDDEELE